MAAFDRRTLLEAAAKAAILPAIGCASNTRPSVSAADPYAAMRGLTGGAAPLGPADHRGHLERAQDLVKKNGHAALVVEAGYTLFHLTGVRWWPSERPFLLVLRPDGPPRYIVPAFERTRALERAGADAELLPWQEDEDPYLLIAKAAGPGTLAVDEEMRHFVVEGLRSAGREVVSGGDLVRDVRMIKTTKELALLESANLATKAALELARKRTAPGMKESELRKIVTEAQEAAGLGQTWALVLFGPNAAFPHGTGKERTLQDGDLVLIDTGGSLHGYRSDITRTWACGTASDEARRAWDTVLAAQSAALEVLRPGVKCGAVDAAARKVISDAGYGAGYEKFWHRLGHGIGLQVHEHPYLVNKNDLVLRPGMTMSNEPGVYVPGKFGVRIEDIVAVTEDGNHVFGERASW